MQSLDIPFRWLESKLSPFLAHEFWRLRVLILAFTISATILLVFSSTFLNYGFWNLYCEMREPGCCGNGIFWDDIIRQGQYPFTAYPYTPGSHESNATFRLTPPLIARIFHLNVVGLYAAHVLAGVVFLWFLIGQVEKLLKDRILTFYFMTGLMGTYLGANFYFNYMGHADAFAFLFMLLVFCTRQPLLLFGYSQAAFWCDERALLNITYVFAWYLLPVIRQNNKEKTFRISQIFVPLRQVPLPIVVLIISAIVYILVRQWLGFRYGLHISHGYEFTRNVLLENLTIVGGRMANGLEGLWFIIIAALSMSFVGKDWWVVILFGGSLLATIASSILVIDITRSLSFGFVGLFLALRILQERIPKHQLRQLLIVSMVVSSMFAITFP